MNHLTTSVIEQLAPHRNAEQATAMEAYMRNHFPFLGIKGPVREKAVKTRLSDFRAAPAEVQIQTVSELFDLPEREYHYAALDLLKWTAKKLDAELFLPFTEKLLQQNSWWDSVDVLSPKIARLLLDQRPDLIVDFPDRWIEDDNFWLQRAALIQQLNRRQEMDLSRIVRYVLRRADSGEFFVQKGAGWALRSASRYFPEEVAVFFREHQEGLPKLTVREGMKLLRKAE